MHPAEHTPKWTGGSLCQRILSGSSHFPPVPMVPSSPKLKMMSVLESNNIDIARWQMGRIRGEFSCRSSKKKGCHIRTCEYMSLDAQKSATTLAAAFTKKEELKSTKNANVSINRAHVAPYFFPTLYKSQEWFSLWEKSKRLFQSRMTIAKSWKWRILSILDLHKPLPHCFHRGVGCLGARRPHVWRPTQVYVYVCV